MPKYLGPYDELIIDGKTYHVGDNVSLSRERMTEIVNLRKYHFEGVEEADAIPVERFITSPTTGAPLPREDEDEKSSEKKPS